MTTLPLENTKGTVLIDITMSLDGFIAGPNNNLERIHHWIFEGKSDNGAAVLEEYLQNLGAVIMGRNTFNHGFEVNGWDGWVEPPSFPVPIFVPSRDVPTGMELNKTAYTFVTDGIESAVRHAKAVAGDKKVAVMGGAKTVQQAFRAGLVDEIQIHVAPVLLGAGVLLFDHLEGTRVELESTRVLTSPGMTHLRYRVVK